MLAVERRNEILKQLKAERRVKVNDLSRQFHVTEETIRRDLEKLSKDGLIIKSYGGAILNENIDIELPFNVRIKKNISSKQQIANIIAHLVKDGDHIILDASSTAIFAAKALRYKERLTVVTNSIEIIVELADLSDIELVLTGGSLKADYLALSGPKTIRSFSEYNVGTAILSCKGLDFSRGMTDGDDSIAETKQAIMRSAKTCILAVDHSKFGKVALSKIDDLEDIDYIVTDKEPDGVWRDWFEKYGVVCLHPGSAIPKPE
jgi:DeoR/GlpR family transcriptional regulator of sugar metabolism